MEMRVGEQTLIAQKLLKRMPLCVGGSDYKNKMAEGRICRDVVAGSIVGYRNCDVKLLVTNIGLHIHIKGILE